MSPAHGPGDAGTAEDDRALADRLRGLSLPLVPGAAAPGRRAEAIVDAAAASALPHGAAILVDPAPGGWRIRIDTGEIVVDVEAGHQHWRESAPLGRPVVATGAWQDDVYVADLYVITGPHRVRLVADAGRAVATWNVVPLVGPDLLRQLRAPLMTRPDVA